VADTMRIACSGFSGHVPDRGFSVSVPGFPHTTDDYSIPNTEPDRHWQGKSAHVPGSGCIRRRSVPAGCRSGTHGCPLPVRENSPV